MDTSRDAAASAGQRELDAGSSTGPHGPFRDSAEPNAAEAPDPPTSSPQPPEHEETWEPL